MTASAALLGVAYIQHTFSLSKKGHIMTNAQAKQQILNNFRSRFPAPDWRNALYNDDQWGIGEVTKRFELRHQGIVLEVGAIVCVQRRVDSDKFVTILRQDFMCSSSVEVKFLKPVA
ncbi:hypothetical protein [Burkholderia phage BCSR5]|nr:hypothetical protein [Burkholderia phage BCSR5]